MLAGDGVAAARRACLITLIAQLLLDRGVLVEVGECLVAALAELGALVGEYQVPDFSTTPSFSAVSTSSPSLLTPAR